MPSTMIALCFNPFHGTTKPIQQCCWFLIPYFTLGSNTGEVDISKLLRTKLLQELNFSIGSERT